MTLYEESFIQEEYVKRPFFFWISAVFSALLIVLISIASYFADELKSTQFQISPFLQVTNREFSLFLWQHPHLMRVHAKNKIGYLTGFQYLHKVNMELALTDEYVTVPPSILFLYHAWKLLVSSYVPEKSISPIEFKEFLKLMEEWQPNNWQAAPKDYVDLVSNIEKQDIQVIKNLPFEVRHAFFGWKNYFKEGEAINAFTPTVKMVNEFLMRFPNYARNYWQNILIDECPNYLKSLQGTMSDALVPVDEIPPFLRVALYNSL